MREKILVVDDDELLRCVLQTFLEKEGYEPVLASGGEEAIRLAESEKPRLLILDAVMPDPDGIKTCAALRAHQKTRAIPVFILTEFEDTLMDALEAEADDFLNTPCKLSELAARVSAMLRVRHVTNEVERAAGYMRELQKAITLH